MSDVPVEEQQRVVIWRRDQTPTKRGWLKWAGLAIFLVCGFGAFAQAMSPNQSLDATFPALGLILLGLFVAMPKLLDINKRRNPEVAVESGTLVWGKVRVPMDEVASYVLRISRGSVYNGSTTVRTSYGTAVFTLNNGDSKKFVWPYLDQPELDQLGVALEPLLPGLRRG